jgi:septal ring factor EnvC (AmiA/AmiB activator)
MVLVAGLDASAGLAGTLPTFDQLHELDRRIERHRVAASRLSRAIDRWEQQFDGTVKEGELADRAKAKLQGRVARRLIAWERIHRTIRRQTPFWEAGRGADLGRLLRGPELESLAKQRELVATIGRLEGEVAEPADLVGRRAELTVELAQHEAAGQAAEAGKRDVVEGADAKEEGVDRQLEAAEKKLEGSLTRLIEHKTGEDFHRRKGTLLPPVSVDPVQGFGQRKQEHSMTYVRHTGLTYAVDPGTSVKSTAGGLVVFAERFAGYGRLVIVDHGDDYHSLYAHLSEMAVDVGDEVERGTPVGASGQSGSLDGPKLYFELRHDERPIDPAPWFLRRKEPSSADEEGAGEE